jgi:hypothetical protein
MNRSLPARALHEQWRCGYCVSFVAGAIRCNDRDLTESRYESTPSLMTFLATPMTL